MTAALPGGPASMPRCYALVPCAGSGTRAGEGPPKQYRDIAGRPMVAWTLDALTGVARIDATLVVLAPGDAAFEARLPRFAGARGWIARCGGDSRAQTVANGLRELRARGADDDDWVLVHDAARCLVRPAWIERLIAACIADGVGGLLALPIADTVKQASGERVVATLDRSDKWAAQTPQMFRIGALQDALAQATGPVTDEASAIEAAGGAPKLVRGEPENFKVTWPGDLDIAERLLRSR